MATSKLILDIIARDQASGKFAALTAGATNLNRSMVSMGKSAAQAGDRLSLGLSLPLLAVGAYAVKTQADFEQSMNVMQKASGASGAAMERLSELAKQLGADTVYSAGEAAEAMVELAKGGLKPAEIEAGALESAMALAATEGMGLADAGVAMVNAMSVFNIEGSKSAKIADALAGGSMASTASVESLAQALRQVGPGATNAGLSLNDTVAALSAFDAAGIKGSDAGTSLKTMLARLVPQTEKAASQFSELGINFVKRNGDFKSLTEIAGILQDKMGDLSEAERTRAMATMFGSDATRAATELMKLGEDGLQKYIDATEKNGAAQKMAEARMDGTAGALEVMKGSVETAALAVGEGLAPTVVDLSGKIADAANWFSKLDEGTQGTIVKMGLMAAAIGPVLSVLGRVTSAVGTAQGALSTLGTKMTALSAAKGSGGVASAIGGLGRMATFLGGPWGLAIMGAIALVGTMALKLKTEATDSLDDYTSALAANKGALDKNIKSQVALNLAQSGELQQALDLGISTRNYTDAVLGNKKAQELVNAQLQAHIDNGTKLVQNARGPGGMSAAMDETASSAFNLKERLNANADALERNRDIALQAAEAQERLNAANRNFVAVNDNAPSTDPTARGARAAGGPVAAANGRYLVGEHGPEILLMGRGARGKVFPHSRSMSGGGGGGVTIVLNGIATDELSVMRGVRKGLLAVKRAEGGRALGLA